MPVPTATQFLADGHDTPVRSASSLPLAGAGTDILAQLLPFHESASAKLAVLVPALPTAMQYAADGQDTLLSSPTTLPFGSGGLDRVHLLPFQDSASAAPPDGEVAADRDAALRGGAGHAGSWPPRCPWASPGRSASRSCHSRSRPAGPRRRCVEVTPTATQALADLHETPSSLADSAPLGAFGATLFQVLPFQVWISAPPPLTLSSAFSLMPTATQYFDDTQDTPKSWLAGGGALAGAALAGLWPAVAGLATAIEAATPSIAVSAISPEAAIVRIGSPPANDPCGLRDCHR